LICPLVIVLDGGLMAISERSEHEHLRARHKHPEMFQYPEIGDAFLWPFALFEGYEEEALEVGRQALKDDYKFMKEVEKTQVERPKPLWATENRVFLDLRTVAIRDFSGTGAGGICTLVVAPYAGHTSVIVDFHKGQSLVEALIAAGLSRVCATDWKSATEDMKDFDIDNYLEELNACVDDLGGRVNLAGMCQGGWLSAMFAARYPHKVNALVLAGTPIDAGAGSGVVKEYAHKYPDVFFEDLVAAGGGLLLGQYMLEGWKSLHPEKQYIDKYVNLFENVDDPQYVRRFENFERWYEYTINLPGRWYLQTVKELFRDNKLYKGEFVGLGRKLNLGRISCPVYLLAGSKDDITPAEQVFNMEKKVAPGVEIVKETAEGGHIGLFMGSTPLRDSWPKIAAWLKSHSGG